MFGGRDQLRVVSLAGRRRWGAQVWVRLGAWKPQFVPVCSSVSCNGFIVYNLFHFIFESEGGRWWDEDIEVNVQLCQYALSGALLLD